MKKRFLLIGILATQFMMAQVGINTEAPKATMDIMVNIANPSAADGLIAPRLTGNALKAKDALYTTDQTGAIVYATAAASPVTPKTINVTEAGYYYFDGNVWMHVNGKEIEPWNIQETADKSTANTDNIYQQGKVAVGFTNADVVSEKQLDVKGDFRASHEDAATQTTNLIESNAFGMGFNYLAAMTPDFSEGSLIAQVKGSNTMQSTDAAGAQSSIQTQVFGNNGFIMASANDTQGRFASFSASAGGSGMLATDNTNTIYGTSNLQVSSAQGIAFYFTDTNNARRGRYIFPRTDGKRGQVLVTHGSPSDPGNGGYENKLMWRDLADVIILKAPLGNCYKLTVSNLGVLGTVPDLDCTVDPYLPDYQSKTVNSDSSISADQVSEMIEAQNKMIKEQNKTIETLKSQMKELHKKQKSK